MSRRMSLCILAAAAALTAVPAQAESDCSGNSCRMAEAAGPAAQANSRGHASNASDRIRVARWPARSPGYGISASAVPASAAVVAVPGALYPDGGVVPAYPYLPADPSWRLCQIERREGVLRYYDCGPYSYHPFGVYGHRPNGTYREYRAAPIYVLAPAAKIIRVAPQE